MIYKRLSILLACLGMFGCSSLKHLDGQTFVTYAQQARYPGSASWYAFVGISRDRAYLEAGDVIFTSSGRPHVVVYWTGLSELPPGIAAELRAGKQVWTNWYQTPEWSQPTNAPYFQPARTQVEKR